MHAPDKYFYNYQYVFLINKRVETIFRSALLPMFSSKGIKLEKWRLSKPFNKYFINFLLYSVACLVAWATRFAGGKDTTRFGPEMSKSSGTIEEEEL